MVPHSFFMLELPSTNLERENLREKEDEETEEKMKRCELCNSPARMYCESDQASLCWNCDSKVHGANFLVARHRRSLLCHVCQCPTPWSSSGADFGPTVSVCRRCAAKGAEKIRRVVACDEIEAGDDAEIDSQADGDEEEEEEMSDSDDGDGEIQVVPRSSTPPPPATSSSSSEEYSSRKISVVSDGDSPVPMLKRVRESSSDLRFQEDLERRSKRKNVGGAAAVVGPPGCRRI